ncbi:MAG: pyrophosphatase PpaX [Planctomycetota bacterium]|jgi:pyrophosphatase PpaX
MTNTSLKSVLFDLDGTLIDSIGLIVESYQHALLTHGKRDHTHAEILAGVGTPLVEHVGQFCSSPDERDAMVATYLKWNRANHDERVSAYPGVADGLGELVSAGLRLAVVTSKSKVAALRGLEVSGLGDLPFEFILGPEDTTRGKPHPEPILKALERMDLGPQQALYVGDSPHDMAAARAAGVGGVAALWGPFERSVLAVHEPLVWLQEPAHLAQLPLS